MGKNLYKEVTQKYISDRLNFISSVHSIEFKCFAFRYSKSFAGLTDTVPV